MGYNRSHSRYLRRGRFARVRHSHQFLAFLDAQDTRLSASRTAKTASVVAVSAAAAAGLLTFAGQPSTTQTITIGSTVFTFKTALTEARATGTATTDNTNPANASTLTLGSVVYTFQTSLTAGTAGQVHVLIGVDADTSLLNLARAINNSGGTPGTDYNTTGTGAHPLVAASASVTSHHITITAILGSGTGGNIASTSTTSPNSHVTFGGATLTGGVSPVAGEVLIDDTAAHTRDNLLHAITYDATAGTNKGVKYSSAFTVANTQVTAAAASANLTVTALAVNATGNQLESTSAATNLTFGDTHLTGGVTASFGPTWTVTGHGYADYEGPFQLSSTVSLPTGAVATDLLWVKVVDANTVKLAKSVANIIAGDYLPVTTAGSGTISLKRSVTPGGMYELLRKNSAAAILAATDIDALR